MVYPPGQGKSGEYLMGLRLFELGHLLTTHLDGVLP